MQASEMRDEFRSSPRRYLEQARNVLAVHIPSVDLTHILGHGRAKDPQMSVVDVTLDLVVQVSVRELADEREPHGADRAGVEGPAVANVGMLGAYPALACLSRRGSA